MSGYPSRHVVVHESRSPAGSNALGQTIPGPPTTRTRRVIGFEPKTVDQGTVAAYGKRTVTERWMLTGDPDWHDADHVTHAGRRWTVVGEDPEDYNLGPFGFKPGYRVLLRRVSDG